MPEKLVQMVARQGCGRPDIIERLRRNTCQTVAMAAVRGVVTRWLDDAFPGWVEFALTDVEGMVHIFHEKAPVLTLELLLASDPYPRELWVVCEVLSQGVTEARLRLWDGIESVDGRDEFTLPIQSVRDDDWTARQT